MWIDKQELAAEIAHFQMDCRASERLGKMLLTIADGAARRYATGLEHDEAVADAVCRLLTILHGYDPSKSDAFAYLTTVCINQFRMMKRREYHRRLLLDHIRQMQKL